MDYTLWALILVGLIFSTHNTSAQNRRELEPLVSFGELEELVLANYSLRSVEDIEPDWLNPGGFIVGNQHSLALISPELTVQILAGRENETAFKNGRGRGAYFNIVQDSTQINNGSDIIIADLLNHCIRRVRRTGSSSVVSTFAGRCTNQGHITEPVSSGEARMTNPLKVLYIEEENIFYYLLPNSVVKHNLTTDTLSLMYKDLQGFKQAYSFVIDSTRRYLYVNHAYGISKIDTVTWTRTLIAGKNYTANIKEDILDGPLLRSRFGRLPTGMTWLIQDQVLLVCDYLYALRIVNLEDGVVYTICKGEVSNDPTFISGGPETCKINSPLTANVIDGTIYIGDSSGTDAHKAGHILTLPYSQPICATPALVGSNIRYEPVRDRYIHKDTVKYTCDRGYGIDGSYDVTLCARARYANGTVYGKWDRPEPVCKPAAISTMVPVKGQLAGGTLVTVNGIFAEDMVVMVSYSNNLATTISFTRQSLKTITFMMPPSHNNINKATISIRFGSSDEAATSIRSYQYLPNPSVRSITRSSSIGSGGLDISFKGDNFQSAYNYTLIFMNASGHIISHVTCPQKGVTDQLHCKTPDFSHIFKTRVKRKAAGQVETFMLTTTLLSDGKKALGNSEFVFTVFNSQPVFESSNNKIPFQFDLRTESAITLNGSHLNISLLVSDYQVSLKFTEDGSVLSCKPLNLQLKSLICEPPVDKIVVPISASNVVAKIQVLVGSLNETVGRVAFYKSTESTSRTTERPQEIVGIVVPIVLSVVVIIVAIIIYFIYKRKHRSLSGILIPTGQATTIEGADGSLEMRLPFELRIKLDDMYIDSSHLSFNLRADPIGKGHFGKVYLGQLQLKGNVLKTVAVKTLKETTDIHVEQLQEFLEEATFLKDFNHANILVTLGVMWRKGDRPNVVLPYMALGDIGSLLRKPDMVFTNGDLIHFGMQVATGMEYLTNNKCLHRDLAARNCLIDDTFLVKIADFGFSRDVYSNNYYRENNRDKPRPVKWMALESLMEGVYNSSTEVWAFGVLMWEILTRGNGPYPGVANCEIVQHLRNGYRLSRPSHTHPQVFEFISTCWLVEPSERPTFTDIREFLEGCILNDGQHLDSEEAAETPTEVPFMYSYARKHTRTIPANYHLISEYGNVVQDIEYVDKTGLIEDYEQPIPEIVAPDSGDYNNHTPHGLDSLTHEPHLPNDYTKLDKSDIMAMISLGNRKPVPVPRLSLDQQQTNIPDSKDMNADINKVGIVMNEYLH